MISTFLLIWACCLVGGLRRDVSLVDIFWGPGFLAAALIVWSRAGSASARHLLHLALEAVWDLRLAVHIAWRGWGKGVELALYRHARKTRLRFWWVSLVTVFLLQGTWSRCFPIRS